MSLTDELRAEPVLKRRTRMDAILEALSDTDRELLMHHVHGTGHLSRPSPAAHIARMLTRGGHSVSSSTVSDWKLGLGDA